MTQIHYFNPGHETAVLLKKKNYTAPSNVKKMQKDLSVLPIWYANDGDFVLAEEKDISLLLEEIPSTIRPQVKVVSHSFFQSSSKQYPTLKATPWGISPHSLHFFEQLHEKYDAKIITPQWKEEFFVLTGRQTAALCLQKIKLKLPRLQLPEVPTFCNNIQEIENFIKTSHPPFIIKTPYSSSGRGLAWIKDNRLDYQTTNWINGAINKQGNVSIEKGLEKVLDFAMEFSSKGKGLVEFEGLSMFNTEERGAYSGNLLESQSCIQERILHYVDLTNYTQIKTTVQEVLSDVYGHYYKGYLGVDMIVYKHKNGSYAIHPCIEINMRCTMGMVAIKLYKKLVHSESIGEYQVCYEKVDTKALKEHQTMQRQHPLVIENSKIKEGYLSLCPISTETKYRAYILVKKKKSDTF